MIKINERCQRASHVDAVFLLRLGRDSPPPPPPPPHGRRSAGRVVGAGRAPYCALVLVSCEAPPSASLAAAAANASGKRSVYQVPAFHTTKKPDTRIINV